jgi:hypothetical protein
MTGFKHVAEDSHGRADCQVLPVVGAYFYCAGLIFLEKARGCQTP